MKKCINCGAELDDRAKFCYECGTKQPEDIRCPQCDSKVDKKAKFCPECGAKLTANTPNENKASIGDNNAISAKDIVMGNNESFQGDKVVVQGDKIQAEHYVINQFTGAAPTEKTESEKEKDRLETVRTQRLFKQESEAEIEALKAKAKDFENKKDYFHAVQIYRELAKNGDLDAACEVFRIVFEKNYNIDKDVLCKIVEDIILPNAKNGHPFAQAITGRYYATDGNKKPDYVEAIKWLEKSTSNGNSFGAYWLAMFYIEDEFGDGFKHSETGVETNNKKAVELLILSAKQGFDIAISILAYIYFVGIDEIPKNYNEALVWAKRGTELGLAECMFYLGGFYFDGVIMEKDEKKAFDLYLKSADNGYIIAQRNVANMYLNGVGVECDKFKAYSWFAKGAENGDIECVYKLGLCYYRGYAVNKDLNEAYKWLKKAYDNGYIDVACELGLICENDGFEKKDLKISTSYYKIAAENGNPLAQNNYGIALIVGDGIDVDVSSGIKWLEQSSVSYDLACCNLGFYYSQGEVVKKDIAKAKEYYLRVINKDPSQVDEEAKARAEEALKALGVSVDSNIGEFTDKETDSLLIRQANAGVREGFYDSAYACCKKAMEKGDPAAEEKLNELYQFGCNEAENKRFRNAVKVMTPFANDGNNDAKLVLADIYVDGHNDGDENDSRNYAKGFNMYKQLADSRNLTAMVNIGWCYENGRGVKTDYKTALKWYQKAIDNGYKIDDWIKERMNECKKNISIGDVVFHDLYADQDNGTDITLHAHFVVSNNYKKKIIIKVTTKIQNVNHTFNKKEVLEQIQYDRVSDYDSTEWKDFQHKLTAKACSYIKASISEPITLITTFEIIDRHGKTIGLQNISYKIKYEHHIFHDNKLLLIR